MDFKELKERFERRLLDEKEIEFLISQVEEMQRALERIAVTFERGEMVRIAYETLRSIKGEDKHE